MNTVALTINIQDEYREALIAELAEMDFHGFEESDESLVAYVEPQYFNDVNREFIEILLGRYPGDNYIISEGEIEEKNWNQEWEESIKPVEAGPFWIQPTWYSHEPPKGKKVLYIDPKMAFGTGYHETTRLLVQALPKVINEDGEDGIRVLDVGTGTGILAIASVKLGAKEALALDIDPWSTQNAAENIYLNNVSDRVTIKEGSTELLVEEDQFDVIIANINRNAITNLAADFVSHLNTVKGDLLLSGLLEKDADYIQKLPQLQGLTYRQRWKEGEWIALWFSLSGGFEKPF